ncbi:unnamed protein product [Chrysoparadoxa australica]
MGLTEALETPATSSLIMLTCCITLWLWHKRISVESVAFSYRSVVLKHEVWRVLTAGMSHFDVLHLLFNLSSLWGMRGHEKRLGSSLYLSQSLLILLCSKLCQTILYSTLIRRGFRNFVDQKSVGYSGVLFGWMTVGAALPGAGSLNLPGNLTLAPEAVPFFNLALAQLLMRRSSFFGHLGGIAAGLAAAWGLLDFLQRPYWAWLFLMWFLVIIGGSLKATTSFPVPFITYIDPHFGESSLSNIRCRAFDWNSPGGFDDYVDGYSSQSRAV